MRWDCAPLDINPVFPGLGAYYYYYYCCCCCCCCCYYYYYYYLCLYVLYVRGPCWEIYKLSSRLSLILYLHFRIFYFCIVELWDHANLKYKRKKEYLSEEVYQYLTEAELFAKIVNGFQEIQKSTLTWFGLLGSHMLNIFINWDSLHMRLNSYS